VRRLLALCALCLALPASASEICMDREGVWRERLPGALYAWEYHVYVSAEETGAWSRLRPSQVRDVLVEAGWGALDNKELLHLSRVIVDQGGQVKGRDQGCGVVIQARAVDKPPGGDVIWDVAVASRGTPRVNGVCEADCFGH
jgi:hypothetical protein